MSNPLQSELRAIYNSLLENSELDSYCAQIVPGFSWARIATKGTCVALITPYAEDMALYNIELEHIKVLFNLQVKIQSDTGSRVEHVSIIECKHSDPWLVDTFLELAAMVLMSIEVDTPISVNNFLRDLVNLFRALNQPSGKSVQGLWGELFLIHASKDPIKTLKAWHSHPRDKYDFYDNK